MDIKDPSFVTMKKLGYLFYIGEVSITPLFGDGDDQNQVHYDELSSRSIQVGIKNRDSTADTSLSFPSGYKITIPLDYFLY